ncbi:MAG: DNA recombination protein RmuC, partial [Candidatus Hydrogenedens sp.]
YRNELTGLTQNIQKISEFQSILNKTFLDETSRNRTEILTSVNTILTSLSQKQLENLHIFSENLNQLTQMNQKSLTDINETLKSELQKLNVNTNSTLKDLSQSQLEQLKAFTDNLNQLTQLQVKQLTDMNETLKNEIRHLQEKNDAKLEEMRKTVDEKLQTTLENRLTQSFKTVSEQLESVYKGLGEMKTLASDVGDLKRVLTNVKQRGVFGELQLEGILEDILTSQQYEKNARIKRDTTVEFAIKIPAKDERDKYILLPIDSKFPREDYERILTAQENADANALSEAVKSLSIRITGEARDISEKYIDPPHTTDFAIMFLPVEGLFAEVLRIPGLFEKIRKDLNVIITGPTTITAILNSLQMGFRTLAIEKKSQEVWKVLGAIKTEFKKFNDLLTKTKEKLESAANEIEKAQKKTQMIDRKLKGVEQLDMSESQKILALEDIDEVDREDIH